MRPLAFGVLAVLAVAVHACQAIPELTFTDGGDGSASDADASSQDASTGDGNASDGNVGPFGCPSAPQANVTCCGAQACVGACTATECTECATDCKDLGQVCCARNGKNKCANSPGQC